MYPTRLSAVIHNDLQMTQKRFCEVTGFDPGYLSEILNNKNGKRLGVDHIQQFCAAIRGLEPWQFFYTPESMRGKILSRQEKAFLDSYLKLGDGGKAEVLALIDELLTEQGVTSSSLVDGRKLKDNA